MITDSDYRSGLQILIWLTDLDFGSGLWIWMYIQDNFVHDGLKIDQDTILMQTIFHTTFLSDNQISR